MRVSDANFVETFLRGIRANREVQDRSLRELSDGKRVRLASDDPVGARSSLEHRARLARLAGYGRASSAGRTSLESLDVALGSAFGIVSEARSLALAGASGVSNDGNAVRAVEVEGLRDRLLDLANLRQDNHYLFSGTATDTQPFDDAGDYFGNGDETRIPVSDTRTIGITMAGDSVFLSGGSVFGLLGDLAQALRNDDTDTIESITADLTTKLDHLSIARAEAGTRMRTLDASVDTHADEAVRLRLRISEIEDVRIEEVAVSLASAGTALDALATSAGRVLGRSLFEFLV